MAYSMQPITVTAATTLNADSHAGNVVVLNSTTGRIITLPAATGKGDEYTLFISATVSSGSHVLVVSAGTTDSFGGGVCLSTDIGGTNMLAAADSDTITMNGSTTGGVVGSWLFVKDVAAGKWMLDGFLACTGTEATPFSAAV
jgi:hypothetical protein